MTTPTPGGYSGTTVTFDPQYIANNLTPSVNSALFQTELSGNQSLIGKFSFAGNNSNSTYSFGVYQYDVGNNSTARSFLSSVGFSSTQISQLSQHGGLSSADQSTLNTQLAAALSIPANMATLSALDTTWGNQLSNNLQTVLSDLWMKNPDVARQITQDPALQVNIIDYYNQFGFDRGGLLSQYLSGYSTPLTGGTLQIPLGATLTSSMLNTFRMDTLYGQQAPAAEQSRVDRLTTALSTIDTSIGPTYLDISGSCVNPFTFQGLKIRFLDSSSLEVDGAGNKFSIGSNSNVIIENDSQNMATWNGSGNPHVTNSVTDTGAGVFITLNGAGQTDVNATGATIKISNNFYSDNIAGANTINLNNAFATLADGSTDSLSGTGYVAASYGTVNLSGSANLKFSGNNEAVNNSNGTDTLEMSGLDNKVVGSGATITQDALSSLSVIGSNNIYDPYSDVALWAVGSSINLNNNSLTDINLFGNGNSLFGNGAYDTFNIFATTSYDYLNYSTASYIGASTYDYSYGAGTTSFTNTTPDYSYFDFAVSFDDPVVLNLVGTKVQTQNLVSSTAYFDMQNNGTKVHTGWGTAGEGYLVYDPANKNTVTDDQSLVASFAAMKALDQNGDGMLSALDKSWASMKVWVDAAGNGAFVAGSLKTMDQIGIASINLNAAHVNTNQNNNTILDDSTFTWKTGATGDIAGVDFNFHAASVVTPVVHTGGGGGGCVQYASLLPDGRTAGEMVIGSEMVLAHEQTLEAGTGVVRFSQRRTFPGFRITTESGITLVCSETAPIPTPNGLVRPPELLGLQVAVRRDEGGSFMTGWEKVTRVDPVGAIDVQQIDVGDRCFWAGEHANAFILHHNIGAYKMIP